MLIQFYLLSQISTYLDATPWSSIPCYSLRQSGHPIILHICLSLRVTSNAGNSFCTV